MVFEHAGQNPGLEIWRIEDFEAVPYDDDSGKFHTGDSYIILHVIIGCSKITFRAFLIEVPFFSPDRSRMILIDFCSGLFRA